MARTITITMSEQNFDFVHKLSKEESGDLSEDIGELIKKGRAMLAIERYKKNQLSLGKAADLAGLGFGEMMDILAAYGITSNLEDEDYLKGLDTLRKVW